MKELTSTTNYGIAVKEYQGQRVVTFKDIDQCHERKEGTASNNFRKNKDKFIEGTDYYKVPKNELTGFLPANPKIGNPNLPIVLLAQTGYLMIVKTFTDKKSWEIQRVLVDSYFNGQAAPAEIQPPQLPSTGLNPQLQMFKALFDNAVVQDTRIKEVEDKVSQMQKQIDAVQSLGFPETTEPLDALFIEPVTRYTTTEIGKAFNISAMAVNRYLLFQNVHSPYKRGWKLHAKYDDSGYVDCKIGKFAGEETYLTYWTAAGKDFVCALLKTAGLKQKRQPKPYNRHANRGKRTKKKVAS